MSRYTGPRPVRRGLVIGAGAALGGAWALGALRALEDVEGYDPAQVDVVVGTSAGSVLAALIGCGVPSNLLVELLAGDADEVDGTAPVNALDVVDPVHRALGTVPWPLPLPGNPLLIARSLMRPSRHTLMTAAAALAPRGRGCLAPIGQLVAEYASNGDWPNRPRTWLAATDFDSGRRVVFGRAGAPRTGLPTAVMASCAAPGYFPPVPVAGRRYVDGGAVSVTNADVLTREHLDEILVLAPMGIEGPDPRRGPVAHLEGALRRYASARLQREVDLLAAGGARVRVFVPTTEDLAVIGANVMDPARRRDVFRTAFRTSAARLTAPAPDIAA